MNWVNAQIALRTVSITKQTLSKRPTIYTPAWVSLSRFPISDVEKGEFRGDRKYQGKKLIKMDFGEQNNNIRMLWVMKRQ